MEVLCACDERYLPHAATMLCSLLEHNNVIRIHLFLQHDREPGTREIDVISGKISQRTCLIRDQGDRLHRPTRDDYALVAVYYRLLAPRLLPTSLGKVLYLDCDIIVRRSLRELWNTDITGCALAAVPDLCEKENGKALDLPIGAKYFNSGVLLINLWFWRENNVPERSNFLR